MPLGSRSASLPAAIAGATLLALAAPHPASAAWPPLGRAISRINGDQSSAAIAEDGADGAILTWIDLRNPAAANVYAGHVLASGEIDALWPVNGRALRTNLPALGDEPQDPALPAIVPDGAGGAIVVWQDGRSALTGLDIFAQHVLASGGVDPAWPSNGTPLCVIGGVQDFPTLVSDGAGGAIATWIDLRPGATVTDVYAQHVFASGVVDARWPVNGVAVSVAPGHQVRPTIVDDGVGGAIVTWFDGRDATSDDDIYAQHVLASGIVDPAWPVNGRAVCTAIGPQFEPEVISDGAHGAVVTWYDDRTSVSQVFAHHVLATGAVDPAWPVNGRSLTNGGASEEEPSLVSDGSGGAVVAFQAVGNGFIEVRAQHVSGAGVVDPVWPAGGALIRRASQAADAEIASDGAGGALVVWREGAGIAARHVLAGGTFDPAYPDTGRAIIPLPSLEGPSGVVEAGPGGAIVAWSDSRSGAGLDVYAMQVLEATITGAPDGSPPGVAFFRPRPNPARDATALRFSLPSEAGVHLAIYDVRGARVRELVSGSRPPGNHTVVWDLRDEHGRAVGTGVYFAKLEVGDRTMTRKLVFLH